MSLIAVISDMHFSADDPYGLNKLKTKCLSQFCLDYKDKADLIVCTGDGQHRNHFNTESVMAECEGWMALGDKLDKLVYLVANHDVFKGKYSPIMPFAAGRNIRVIGSEVVDWTSSTTKGVVSFQGWSESPIPNLDARFYFGHRFVHFPGDKFQKPGTVTAYNLQSLGYEAIVLGDRHESLNDGKVWTVGCLPSSFKDANLQAGYLTLEYDNSSHKITRHRFYGYPVFKKFMIDETETYPHEIEVKGNIVKIELKGSAKWGTEQKRQEIEQKLKQMSPYWLKVEPLGFGVTDVLVKTQPTKSISADELIAAQDWPLRAKEICKL